MCCRAHPNTHIPPIIVRTNADISITIKAMRKELKNLQAKSPFSSFHRFRDLCVHTDGQTDMARSICLVILIKNFYAL